MPQHRTPFVGGNWKMNLTREAAGDLACDLGSVDGVDLAVFPAFVHLETVARELADAAALGAQDLFYEGNGAFTGEISIAMLSDMDATCVLTGHSERRHVIGESDDLVGRKTTAAIAGGLTAVLCIGELLEEREAGETDRVNERQLRAGLDDAIAAGATDLHEKLVIAYEPVWAIGTGKTATPEDAQAAHKHVRAVLAQLVGDDVASQTRIIYGGSMKPGNAAELMAQPDIDGGLVGGASLKAKDFTEIAQAAANA